MGLNILGRELLQKMVHSAKKMRSVTTTENARLLDVNALIHSLVLGANIQTKK